MENPWLRIPAEDYEGHMRAAGQAEVLRNLFARAYLAVRPRRLAILGCTTGTDFEYVDPSITEESVGIDLNSEYLTIARTRLSQSRLRSTFLLGDLMEVDLPVAHFDLIHVALVLEYVDPVRLFSRVQAWLADGGTCSVISQEPATNLPAVTPTGYDSLKALSACMVPRTAQEIERLGAEAGLRLEARTDVSLPSGKMLVSSTFEKRRAAAATRAVIR